MGGAMIGGSDNAMAVNNNPAGLTRINKGDFAGGLGIFSQGGMGAHYKGLNTAFGTKDETYTNVAYGKLAPSLALETNKHISLGATVNVE